MQTKKNPAGSAVPGRANKDAYADSREITPADRVTSNTNFAAAVLVRRFGLSPARASLVADLAGFAPILPALIEGVNHG